jgi:hypothetical protein
MKREIITICGSTKFSDLMAVIAYEMTKAGKIVFCPSFLPSWYLRRTGLLESHFAEQEGFGELFSNIYNDKIALANKIFVCNQNGYIGKQTKKEIDYAISLNKPILYLEMQENEFNEMTRKISGWWMSEGIG